MAVRIESDRIVKVSELHNDTSKWVEAAQEGPLFIMRYGTPKAVLIGIGVFEELLDRIQLKFELQRREKTSKGKIALEEIQKQYGL
jgi:antitoxin (DNA-binding transcriptional repressor) of toxin-antitoxin stability system